MRVLGIIGVALLVALSAGSVACSDVSNGDKHNHDDMPVIVAGGAAGFRLGQHVNTNGAWFGDLFLAIAKGFGINNLTTFGEQGKAPLTGIT